MLILFKEHELPQVCWGTVLCILLGPQEIHGRLLQAMSAAYTRLQGPCCNQMAGGSMRPCHTVNEVQP